MIEGMAAVVQRGIDEILSLRASNKQLLEALRAITENTNCDYAAGVAREAIYKAEEN